MRYYTSDWHLQHARIIELCDRPFKDVDHMDSTIIDNVNSILDPDIDELFILGDICMGNMEKSLRNLGRVRARRVVMFPGNHDRWSLAYHTRGDHYTKRRSWQKRYEEALTSSRGMAMSDRSPSQWRTKIHELTASCSHYPWEGDSHGADRYKELRPLPGPGFLIHGHVHNAWRTNGRQFNVGVDVNDFKPVSENTLYGWMVSFLGDEARPTFDRDQALDDASRPRGLRGASRGVTK